MVVSSGGDPDLELIWGIAVDLRKELVEAQKLRATIIQFKITFLTGLIGLIAALVAKEEVINIGQDTSFAQYFLIIILFSLPAFTSIFFDFLVDGCSIKIDKIGQYCRQHIEKIIRKNITDPDFRTWEQYLERKKYQNIHKIQDKYKNKKILKIVPLFPREIKDKHIFYHPSYLGDKLLTLLSILIATVSIILVVWVVGINKKLSFNFIGLCIVGIIIILTLWNLFTINIELYSDYYDMCHNDFQERQPVYKLLDKLLNDIEKHKGEQRISKRKENLDTSIENYENNALTTREKIYQLANDLLNEIEKPKQQSVKEQTEIPKKSKEDLKKDLKDIINKYKRKENTIK